MGVRGGVGVIAGAVSVVIVAVIGFIVVTIRGRERRRERRREGGRERRDARLILISITNSPIILLVIFIIIHIRRIIFIVASTHSPLIHFILKLFDFYFIEIEYFRIICELFSGDDIKLTIAITTVILVILILVTVL